MGKGMLESREVEGIVSGEPPADLSVRDIVQAVVIPCVDPVLPEEERGVLVNGDRVSGLDPCVLANVDNLEVGVTGSRKLIQSVLPTNAKRVPTPKEACYTPLVGAWTRHGLLIRA